MSKKKDGTRYFTDDEMKRSKIMSQHVFECIKKLLEMGLDSRKNETLEFLATVVSFVAWTKDLEILDFERMEYEKHSDELIGSTIDLAEACQQIVIIAKKQVQQVVGGKFEN